MLSQNAGSTQLLGFTHRLIALKINRDVILYGQLCRAYAALIAGQIITGYAEIKDLVTMPTAPTAQTLQAAIEMLIKQKGK